MAIKGKKGDKILVKGFTGMDLGVFPILASSEKSVKVKKADGSEMIFGRKTGKQLNVAEGKERYANKAMDDDGSFTPRTGKPAKKKTATKTNKKTAKPVDEEPEELDEDEYEDEEEEEKPAKKQPKKPATKKGAAARSKKKVAPEPEEDEDDDNEYEDVDE